MITIEKSSPDQARPYLNLEPILELLEANGNRTVDGGFLLNPDGWRCRMAKELDMGLIRSRCVLPASILLSEEHDTVLDQNSWCVIEGPGAELGR